MNNSKQTTLINNALAMIDRMIVDHRDHEAYVEARYQLLMLRTDINTASEPETLPRLQPIKASDVEAAKAARKAAAILAQADDKAKRKAVSKHVRIENALAMTCPKCGASPGSACVTLVTNPSGKKGKPAAYFHPERAGGVRSLAIPTEVRS